MKTTYIAVACSIGLFLVIHSLYGMTTLSRRTRPVGAPSQSWQSWRLPSRTMLTHTNLPTNLKTQPSTTPLSSTPWSLYSYITNATQNMHNRFTTYFKTNRVERMFANARNLADLIKRYGLSQEGIMVRFNHFIRNYQNTINEKLNDQNIIDIFLAIFIDKDGNIQNLNRASDIPIAIGFLLKAGAIPSPENIEQAELLNAAVTKALRKASIQDRHNLEDLEHMTLFLIPQNSKIREINPVSE